MKKISKTIIFFGSGPVAARSLQLLSKNFVVEAVVTKPKPEHHKGNFPVIDIATDLSLPIRTISSKGELSSLLRTKPFTSTLGVLIDFGIIVDQDVIDYFPLGIINSHFSLLPEWRGADPITFSILSGQSKTGVSLMLIDAGLDTGKIIAQRSIAIDQAATTPSLTEQLITLSNQLLNEYVPGYVHGTIKARSQPHPDQVTYSRKLTKDEGTLDVSKAAAELEREVRAFLGWPKSTTSLAGKEVIITQAHVAITAGVKELAIKTGKDYLVIDRLKPAGKQEMSAEAFLAGYGKLL